MGIHRRGGHVGRFAGADAFGESVVENRDFLRLGGHAPGSSSCRLPNGRGPDLQNIQAFRAPGARGTGKDARKDKYTVF